jgi:hypothetical protein
LVFDGANPWEILTMNRYILATLCFLLAVVGLALAAPEAHAAHAGYGCGHAAASCGGHYGGWRPVRWLLGVERRQARRARRHARWAAHYGCAGAPASCSGAYLPTVEADCPHCPTTAAAPVECPSGICPKL